MIGADELTDGAAGVQAIETGARILAALTALGAAPMLKDLAREAGMPPSKVHRYLASFLRAGLVGRDPVSGHYQLGPLAIQIGLAALRRLDAVNIATPRLAPLRDQIGHTVFIAVWGSNGPTIVRSEESNDPLVISSRAGSVFPILPSSTGRIFGAFLSSDVTATIVERELLTRQAAPRTRAEVQALFADVRARGIAWVQGDFNPGIHALSAPIFNHDGVLVAAITALGVVGGFDASPDGPIAAAVRSAARDISVRLGATSS